MEGIAFLIILGLGIVAFFILVALWRWVFRIDQIVDLLNKIEENTTKDHSKYLPPSKKEVDEDTYVLEKAPPESYCDACKKRFLITDLYTVKINGTPKVVCSPCKKFLKS